MVIEDVLDLQYVIQIIVLYSMFKPDQRSNRKIEYQPRLVGKIAKRFVIVLLI